MGDQLTIVERMSLASGTSGGTAQLNRVSALRTKLRYLGTLPQASPQGVVSVSRAAHSQVVIDCLAFHELRTRSPGPELDQHAEYLHNPAQ